MSLCVDGPSLFVQHQFQNFFAEFLNLLEKASGCRPFLYRQVQQLVQRPLAQFRAPERGP